MTRDVENSDHFHLMPCDALNYNDVTYAADSQKSVKDALFTDI